VAVVTLALGVSATTAIFSVAYGTFFAPLPYYKADRLVMVWESLGTIGAALIGQTLKGAVYGVEATNPLTFAIVAVTLLTAALVACLVPARRAASVDPMEALRQE